MVLAARSGAQLQTAECRVLRVDELGWQEPGHLDPGPGCQVPGGQVARSSTHLLA